MSQRDFAALGLLPELVAVLGRRGYREPLPIQAEVIPAALDGQDLLIQAKTGSGKTLAYGLPLLQRAPSQAQHPEALVLAPTRELARQVESELAWAGEALGRIVAGVHGGGRMDKQVAMLAKGANVAVGTPGRMLELIQNGALRVGQCRYVVLDEVDELLARGFGPEIEAIVKQLPKDRQSLFCSATVPVEVQNLARDLGRSVRRVALSEGREVPAEVEHRVVYTTIEDREKDLAAWLRLERPFQCLVFTGSRQEAEAVTTALAGEGFDVEYFHGDLSPAKRKRQIDRFRAGDLPVLVATDIVARGMDLPGVTHVVNHSLPKAIAAYIHRTGRTGRAGKAGMAVSLVIPQEVDRLERLRQEFAFQAVTVKGSRAGEVRPLRSEKLHLSRAERRGVRAPEQETRAGAKPKAPAKPKPAAGGRSGKPSGGGEAAKPPGARPARPGGNADQGKRSAAPKGRRPKR